MIVNDGDNSIELIDNFQKQNKCLWFFVCITFLSSLVVVVVVVMILMMVMVAQQHPQRRQLLSGKKNDNCHRRWQACKLDKFTRKCFFLLLSKTSWSLLETTEKRLMTFCVCVCLVSRKRNSAGDSIMLCVCIIFMVLVWRFLVYHNSHFLLLLFNRLFCFGLFVNVANKFS